MGVLGEENLRIAKDGSLSLRNVRWFSSPNKRMLANSSLPCYTSLIHQNKEERYCAYKTYHLPLTTYHLPLISIRTIFYRFLSIRPRKNSLCEFFCDFLYLFGKSICLASEKIQKHTSIEVKKDEKA